MSLQSDSALKLIVVLLWRDYYYSTHTHTYLDVSALPPDYISHQPPGLSPTSLGEDSQLHLHDKFFFFFFSI